MNTKLHENLKGLGYHLRLKFNLPPNRPTPDEVLAIVRAINRLPENQRTEYAWQEVVRQIVKFDGMYLTEGLDNSDLNFLLDQILELLK